MYKFLILILILPINLFAQNIKGLYVDGFSTILGNALKEDSLLNYAQAKGFNYLCLYQMHIVNAATPLNNASACVGFTNFVQKAKTQYGIAQIGVAGENYTFFANNIFTYNAQHALASQKIDVYNVEFEFWVPSSIGIGGVYCTDYLAPAGYTCDSAGAITYYVKMLREIDSLANAGGSISETYFGWFSATEANQIVQTNVDRILLSVYLPSANYSASYQYNYIKGRLQHLASANQPVKVLPIYSAEPSFMQSWLTNNTEALPFINMQQSLSAETASWKNKITLEGIQWFAYTDMPKTFAPNFIKEIDQQTVQIASTICDDVLDFSINKNTQISIVDFCGKIILQQQYRQGNHQINVHALPAGVYFLHCHGKDAKVVKKFLKR
jgi:Secretion system C-terminal sorting domain